MSQLTKLIPALSKKNLAKTAGSLVKSLVPAPVSAAWNAITQKTTGATPSYPTVSWSPVQGGPVGTPSHIIEDLLGKFKEASGWNQVGKWLGAPQAGQPSGGGGIFPIPVTATPMVVPTMKAPKGYVLVTAPDGSRIAVLAAVAYALGLKKRPRKSVAISSRDIAGARKVQGFIQRYSVNRRPKAPVRRGRKR